MFNYFKSNVSGNISFKTECIVRGEIIFKKLKDIILKILFEIIFISNTKSLNMSNVAVKSYTDFFW